MPPGTPTFPPPSLEGEETGSGTTRVDTHTSPGPDPLARLIAADDSGGRLADALLAAEAAAEITWADVERAIAELHGVLDRTLADTTDPLLDWTGGGAR